MAPSTWQFEMFEPEFYRLQNQQANPTQQQMPTPIIRRITCERRKEWNENWSPFFHQKIQVGVKKTRELFHIFIIYPTSIFHFLFYFFFVIHPTSIPTTPAKKPPAPPKVCKSKSVKAKLKEELNAINSIVIQRWVIGKDRNKTRRTAKKRCHLFTWHCSWLWSHWPNLHSHCPIIRTQSPPNLQSKWIVKLFWSLDCF